MNRRLGRKSGELHGKGYGLVNEGHLSYISGTYLIIYHISIVTFTGVDEHTNIISTGIVIARWLGAST